MLSQVHFCMVSGMDREYRLVNSFQQYYAGQIGQGLQRYTALYELCNHCLTRQIITPSLPVI